MSSKPTVFVREATGLVREISRMDHLVTNMNGVVPTLAIAYTPFWIFVAIPGGDPIIAVLIACLFSVFGPLAAYAMTAATFPRSGSPYVTQSRVLKPWIGWPSEVLMWFSWISALALGISYCMSLGVIPGLYAMGISSGNPGLIATANWLVADPTPSIVFGTIFLLFCLGIATIRTTNLVRNFQLPITIVATIGVLMMIGAFAVTSQGQFASLMPKYLGNTREGIIAAGKDLPSMVPISGAFYPLMASAGFTAGATNCYWNAWAAGEVKDAKNVKMQIMAMTVPSILITVLCGIIYSQLYGLAGREFLIALTNFSYMGSQVVKAPLSWGGVAIPYIALMAVDNFWLQLILLLGLAAAAVAYVPAAWLLVTRSMFAWSFDRLLPAKFSEVNERFHTPVWTMLLGFGLAEILMVIYTYYAQYFSVALLITWDTSFISVTILCIAAALLPLRKNLWDNSPVKNWKVAGIPVISIVGIIGAYFDAFAVWVYTFTPAVGYGGITDFGIPRATWVMILIAAVPFVLFWIVRAYRKGQGIDIDIIFREVPPE